jgi:cytochrome b6-f complex subunit 5
MQPVFTLQGKSIFKIYDFPLLSQNLSFMVEPLLSGIVLGLIPVTFGGLFTTAYLQYRRGEQMLNTL